MPSGLLVLVLVLVLLVDPTVAAATCEGVWGGMTDGGLTLTDYTLPFAPYRKVDTLLSCGELYRLYASEVYNKTDAEAREVLGRDAVCGPCGPGSCFPLCLPMLTPVPTAVPATPGPTPAPTPLPTATPTGVPQTLGPTLAPTSALRVLFIGNSYSFDLPAMFRELVETTVPGRTVTVDARLVGGWLIDDHAADATSMSKVRAGNYDYLVLQDQSEYCSGETSCEPLVEAAGKTGAVTVIFQTWGRRDDFETLSEEKQRCADRQSYYFRQACWKSSIARVGEIFDAVRDEGLAASQSGLDPGQNASTLFHKLYLGDGSHPSVAGRYATAVSIFLATNPDFATEWDIGYVPAGVEVEDAGRLVAHAREVREVYSDETSFYIGKYIASVGYNIDIRWRRMNYSNFGWKVMHQGDLMMVNGVLTFAGDMSELVWDANDKLNVLWWRGTAYRRVREVDYDKCGLPQPVTPAPFTPWPGTPMPAYSCEEVWNKNVLFSGPEYFGTVLPFPPYRTLYYMLTCSEAYRMYAAAPYNFTDAEIREFLSQKDPSTRQNECVACGTSECYPLCIDTDTPVPTLAPSGTVTPSPTPMPTPGPTPTPSTVTPSPTSAATPSPTPMPTPGPTPTSTDSVTPSPTPMPTTTPAPTTMTPSPTATPTVAPSPTPMPTPGPTPTPSTVTPSPTSAATPSPTPMPTDAPTSAPTAATPSPTPGPTPVPTGSSPTPMPTTTPAPTTMTSSPTATPTVAPSPTPMPTPGPTPVPTGAATPSPTPMPTTTPAPTTMIPSPTATPTVAPSPTPMPTPGPTPTPSTVTPAPTSAATPSPTPLPTIAPTSAPTAVTPSPTPGPTPVPTGSVTPSPTPMPTPGPATTSEPGDVGEGNPEGEGDGSGSSVLLAVLGVGAGVLCVGAVVVVTWRRRRSVPQPYTVGECHYELQEGGVGEGGGGVVGRRATGEDAMLVQL